MEVQNQERKVLTSLQGAWHNHGHRTHCMVRSSTMESWATPAAFPSLHQPRLGPLLAGTKGKKVSALTSDPELDLFSIRRCEGGDPDPPEAIPKSNPCPDTGLPLETK